MGSRFTIEFRSHRQLSQIFPNNYLVECLFYKRVVTLVDGNIGEAKLVLEFLKRGCSAVRSLRPGAPSPDCEAVDLAWIVDVGPGELDDALRAARLRVGRGGRVIVEGTACPNPASIRDRAVTHGLDVVSFDHRACRLVLMSPRPAMAA